MNSQSPQKQQTQSIKKKQFQSPISQQSLQKTNSQRSVSSLQQRSTDKKKEATKSRNPNAAGGMNNNNIGGNDEYVISSNQRDIFNDTSQNIDQAEENTVRNSVNPFLSLSPNKPSRDLIDRSRSPTGDSHRHRSLSNLGDERKIMKVRFTVGANNEFCSKHEDKSLDIYCRNDDQKICVQCLKEDHEGHKFESIVVFLEFKKNSWTEYFQEQRQKIKLLLSGLDQDSWNNLESDLKVTLSDPFIKANQILGQLDEFELSIMKLISAQNIGKLLGFDNRRELITKTILEFHNELSVLKAFVYFAKKIRVKEIEEFKMQEQMIKYNQESIQYVNHQVNELRQEMSDSGITQIQQQQNEMKKYGAEISLLKKNQAEIVTSMEQIIQQHNQFNKDSATQTQNLNKSIKEMATEFDKIKKQFAQTETLLRQKMEQISKDIETLNKKNFNSVVDKQQEMEGNLIKLHDLMSQSQLSLQKEFKQKIQEVKQIISEVENNAKTLPIDFSVLIEKSTHNIDSKLKLLDIDMDSIKDQQKQIKNTHEQIQKDCENANKNSKKMKQELENYIDEERLRKKQAWSVDYGEEAKVDTTAPISTLLLLSNSQLVVAQSEGLKNQIIEIYDANNDYNMTQQIYTQHENKITCMVEHHKLLLTGSMDCSIAFWDIYNNYQLIQQYRQNADEGITCLLSIDQRYFLSSCQKGSLKIWDSVNHSLSMNKASAHSGRINHCQILSKFRLITCSHDKNATIWQLQGNNMQKVNDLQHNSFVVNGAEINEKEGVLATVTMQGYVFLWDKGNTLLQQIKLDSEMIMQAQLMMEYDYQLFPFMVVKTSSEIHFLQLTTGKSQRIKIKLQYDSKDNCGQKKLIQLDQQHLLIAESNKIRVVLIEFENLKEASEAN